MELPAEQNRRSKVQLDRRLDLPSIGKEQEGVAEEQLESKESVGEEIDRRDHTVREDPPPPSVSLEQVVGVLRENQVFLQDLALRPDLGQDIRRLILDHLNGGEWFPDICVGVGSTITGNKGEQSKVVEAGDAGQGYIGSAAGSLEGMPPVPLPFPMKVEFPGEPDDGGEVGQPEASSGRI